MNIRLGGIFITFPCLFDMIDLHTFTHYYDKKLAYIDIFQESN